MYIRLAGHSSHYLALLLFTCSVYNNNNNNNNNLVARGFASAGIPVTKEPSGLFRSDGKRPDGLSLIP